MGKEIKGSSQVSESGRRMRRVLITLDGAGAFTFAMTALGANFVECKHIQRASNLGSTNATMKARNSIKGEPTFQTAAGIDLFAAPTPTVVEQAALARDNLMVRATHLEFAGGAAETIALELVFD